MFINCPNCSALVAVDLATDLPPERCLRCGSGLQAKTAAGQEPASGPAKAPLVFVPLKPSRPAATTPEPAPGPVPEPEPEPIPGPDAGPAPEPDPTPAPAPVPAQAPAPRFLRRGSGPARPGLRSIAVAAGLAALLVIQLLLADRERLAAHAGWRPVVATLCGVLRCSLPPWREPAAITVEQRDVRALSGRPGMLRVSATIRNDSSRAQAWPRLTLTLSDIDGRALGVRAFEPAEYLASPPQDVTVGSGQSAALQIDIVEPSPHAVAFNFQFD